MSLKITDYFLLLIKNGTDLFNNQTRTRPQETSKTKLTKLVDTFSSKTPLQLDGEKWMLGRTSLEVLSSVINSTKRNNRF